MIGDRKERSKDIVPQQKKTRENEISLMKRIITVLAVAALMAVMVASAASVAVAAGSWVNTGVACTTQHKGDGLIYTTKDGKERCVANPSKV